MAVLNVFNKINSAILIGSLTILLAQHTTRADDEVCESDDCGENELFDTLGQCAPFSKREFGPQSQSVWFGEAQGRLGNQLMGYALLQHFRHRLGVDAFINRECRKYLLKVFTPDSITVPAIEDVYCNWKSMPFEGYHGHIRDALTNVGLRKGRLLKMWPPTKEQPTGYRPEANVCPEQEAMNKDFVAVLRKELKFRPEIETKVYETMTEVARKVGAKRTSDVTFIGVHNRMGDSADFVKRLNMFEEPLRADYFEDAMDYFREEYGDDGDPVAFLYVSNDMEWGRENVGNPNGDVFFVGDGDEDTGIGFDLAVLALSNHTVISRGTFSMWGAMLCGGEHYTEYGVIVPTELQDQ